MILHAESETWCGAVVDLRTVDVDESAVVAAIRGADSQYGARCARPDEVHDRAGYVRAGMALETRTALAAAGRSRGLSTPYDDDLRAVREELAATEDTTVRLSTPSTVSDTDRDRLRERVAELRGRIQALEACDRDASDEQATLRDTARRLSELETRRVAAVEARTQARELRDRRERRMRLEDREANLARDARAHLVDTLHERFATTVDSLTEVGDGPFAADPVTAALAILRIASVDTPVVLAVDRFENPAAATQWLDAPVVRL